ncbi:hypothetical protein LTR10_023495 [Elasticomyces elasticus]|uniref:Developmental regulatory protein wetA n=1 Tax=Exophiala sideris TaxID=1016849 RepID=A0ABR0J381_9EURO|nr:hypothetical protein LTR10_023495 [Elasticomyces elasticus]KAK5024991.1 hypothetical protein LTS07_008369 [Exophiala sideris]KAK5031419.1 hypothetical protein LTR13_007747 [Exophiala sideris]KAK5055029.1 hypothetical protein LTR69_008597 [Exophiala sideris]KAK5179910.1 hypothetical protein LTR44_007726 [Eurotiomycetes sp. CCFEE 6388]
MSFDAGGVAQMTYQVPFNNSIGVSGPGFASRGKGSHIKRLSVAPPPKISTIDETQQANIGSTPRTSRGHLLAGLRTAPKSATVPPATNGHGLEGSRYASTQYGSPAPQTATGTYFPSKRASYHGGYQQGYSLPEQVLAPPTLDFVDGPDTMDQNLYDELIATNNYLAQQQRALQQQLLSVTVAAQQLGGLNVNGGMLNNAGHQFQSPISSPMSIYNQQFQHGLQPVVQPVPGSPGVFAVYNPMTGQSSFVVDKALQQQQEQAAGRRNDSLSPPPATSGPQRHFTESPYASTEARSRTPPKSTPSPQQEVEPLPPPSANAFRRGHRKNASSVNIKTTGEWTKGSALRSAGFPQTPMTGTFGPGQARAGEHPVRQPKGPPHLQELQEKPTSKHEGSKNFATRQRRRAVHDLVRAGRERRSDGRQSGSGAGTPGSENEFNFSVSSDGDSVLAGSTSLSSKPSLGSLRAAASGAIGSEIKERSRERSSVDSVGPISAKSLSSDEGNAIGGPIIEVEQPARRNTPLLVLSSAEKRKSMIL